MDGLTAPKRENPVSQVLRAYFGGYGISCPDALETLVARVSRPDDSPGEALARARAEVGRWFATHLDGVSDSEAETLGRAAFLLTGAGTSHPLALLAGDAPPDLKDALVAAAPRPAMRGPVAHMPVQPLEPPSVFGFLRGFGITPATREA